MKQENYVVNKTASVNIDLSTQFGINNYIEGEWRNMSFKFNESYNIGKESIHVMTFLTNSVPLYQNKQGYIGLAACPSGL